MPVCARKYSRLEPSCCSARSPTPTRPIWRSSWAHWGSISTLSPRWDDNLDRLTETLERARDRSDFVIMTGGLGPTEDDLSREAIAAVLHESPSVDTAYVTKLRAFFRDRGIDMPERNIKQAWILPSVTTLANPVGTAPGWWAERDGKVIVAMPGVPHEMKRMWEHEVVPRLRDRTGDVLFTRTLRVAGLGESSVEERLERSAPHDQSDDRHVRQAGRRRRAYQRQGLDTGGGGDARR